ncbi:MAG: hypothetical protein SGILL_002487 [Bacillariaceae sp.]
MGNSLSATVTLDSDTVTAGLFVSGTINLTVKSAVEKKNLTVAVFGEEKTYVAQPAADDSISKYITDMKWVLYEQKQTVSLPNHPGVKVKPGEYKIRFELPIPANAPTSGSEDEGSAFFNYACRWRNIVRVFFSEKEVYKQLAKVKVKVIQPLDIPDKPVPGQVIRPYLSGSGNISVGYAIDNTWVKPGGTVYLKAVCRNRSNLPIQKLKIRVVECKSWTTKPPVQKVHGHFLTDQSEHGFSNEKIKEGSELAMTKLSGGDMKNVEPLVRKNNAFVMEPSILKEITATLKGIKKKSEMIPIEIPENVNCSYKGVLITVTHRVEVTVVSGRFKGDSSTFQIPITIAHLHKKPKTANGARSKSTKGGKKAKPARG